VIAGLGGRAITRESLQRLLEQAGRDELEPLNFLDLDIELVQRELARERDGLPAGPHAENMLRDLGVVAAEAH